ncbi:unnamed protein product (macronuclear) [Paramecium tetraurelia]|uniref:DUF4604 domain-containing protein n=1 Tax=Paramecium tetraurelia TaxID=5888 RepID=A0CRP2_PARTE|nr:uncharacterized protein GSPATT00009774001 [Paramecium tetraurelia]CAK73459.1 unnamed protein product [Paramecium tetraurelia]|eukprot:XP_001440856.1 hypothetical protein (macronuclear) [Paramecium tetraurelia strain d4-2]
MRKKNQRIDLEFEKPQVKFIEQFRMRVNGGSNIDAQDYKIEDKIQKKVRNNNNDPLIVQQSDDEDNYDVENAQVIDGNGNDGNLEFNMTKFKPEYVGSKKQKIIDQKEKNIKSVIGKQEEETGREKKEEELKKQFAKLSQTQKPTLVKKSKIDEIVKKTNKPTILSFDQDDY